MKIMFVVGEAYLPQMTGGAQSTVHELALDALARGHEVSVLAGLSEVGWIGVKNRALMKLTGRKMFRDDVMKYPVYRRWFTWEDVEQSVALVRPDVAVLQIGKPVVTAAQLVSLGVPVSFFFQDVEFQFLGGDPSTIKQASYISNSLFTARRVREAFGLDSVVIRPLMHADRYTVPPHERAPQVVTFVNPTEWKGRDLAFEIAKHCPEIPFEFVEGWPLKRPYWNELVERVRQLPNVSLRRRTHNMKEVYMRSKIVLVPSNWEEAWGRMASEAHYSGIPVVGSKRGGLPEAIGPGGIVVDLHAPIDEWTSAIRRLWTDPKFYAEKSAAALEYSKRPELDRNSQIDAFLAVLADTATRRQRLVAGS